MRNLAVEGFAWLRKKTTCLLLALIVLGAGIHRLLDFHGKTAGTGSIRLILDSPDIRQLIAHQEWIDQEERQNLRAQARTMDTAMAPMAGHADASLHPERYIPGRLAFIAAMNRQPAITVVARHSSCRFLKTTRAGSGKEPFLDGDYVKVRITSGPSKGQEGWSCMFEDVALSGPIMP